MDIPKSIDTVMEQINLIDRSNYFKGLLLLCRKDERIDPSEEKIMMKVGSVLGFEESFIKNAMAELLENNNILDTPPQFSSEIITKSFIKDGLKLSASDNDINPKELYWLKEIAKINSISEHWVDNELKTLLLKSDTAFNELDVNNLSL